MNELNDEIDEALCLVAYAPFEEATVNIKACVRGALLAKADIVCFQAVANLSICFQFLRFLC